MAASWRETLRALDSTLGPSPGLSIYLAGGGVRDLLLGREPADLDILCESSSEASRESILRAMASLSGMSPVAFERRPPATYRVSVEGTVLDATFFAPGGIREALERRDFTLNAMAIPIAAIASGSSDRAAIVDPFGGLADLDARRLRTVTGRSLDEDPLRMLRAVRLSLQLEGFTLEPALCAAIAERASRILEPAAERVGAEIEKILLSPAAGAGMRLLDRLGLLAHCLPELTPLRGLVQPPKHHAHDAFEHTLRAVQEADAIASGAVPPGWPVLLPGEAATLRWAALLHDAGKAATLSVGADAQPRFHGHEMVSAALAEAAMRRLRRPENFVARVADLIRWHLRPGALASPPAADRPVRRLAREAGASLGLLLCLALADRRASGAADSKERERALIHLGDRALSAAAVAAHRRGEPPLLDGHDVMRLLSIPHGPRVGAILRWLERERLDGVIRTREEAEALLQSLPPPRIQD